MYSFFQSKNLPRLLLLLLFFVGLNHVRLHFIDYSVYESAAKKIVAGDIHNLYDTTRNSPGGFYYSYFFALAFTPFVYLGPIMGRICFFLLLFLCYLKILSFSVARAVSSCNVSEASSVCWITPITILLSIYALNDALMNANIGIILLAMSIVAYEQAEKTPSFSGFLLGSAITFKIYPILIFFFFVWSKQYRVVVWALLWTAILFLLTPIICHGWNDGMLLLQNQFYVVSHFGNHWRYDSIVFQNIPSTSMRYATLIGKNPDSVYMPTLIVSCFLVFLLYLKSFFLKAKDLNKDFKEKMFLFLLALALVPLLVPVSWYNMALFYVPILAHLVCEALVEADTVKKRQGAKIALSVYALLFCLTTPDIVGTPLNDKLEFFAVPFCGVITVVGYFLFRVIQKYPRYFA